MLDVFVPGPVTGKRRPRFSRRNGAVYTPAKTATAEACIGYALAQAWQGRQPLEGALELHLGIYVAIPKSKPKKWKAAALGREIAPTSRPDVDNVLKLVGDAGNGVVWRDDSQISRIFVERWYSDQPGLQITVLQWR